MDGKSDGGSGNGVRLRVSRCGRSRWTGSVGALGHGLEEWRVRGRGNGCGEIGIAFEDRWRV
jgi:hypothetical protein